MWVSISDGVPGPLMVMVTRSRRIAWQINPLISKTPKMPITWKANIVRLILSDLLLLFGHPGALF